MADSNTLRLALGRVVRIVIVADLRRESGVYLTQKGVCEERMASCIGRVHRCPTSDSLRRAPASRNRSAQHDGISARAAVCKDAQPVSSDPCRHERGMRTTGRPRVSASDGFGAEGASQPVLLARL